MKSYKTADEYILDAPNGKEILIILRDILNSTELEETIKWGSPVYTIGNKNVAGMASFKSYVGLWFFQGSFLKDEAKVLVNAQEGTTKALRQWRFSTTDEVDQELVMRYIREAIQNQKEGKELKPDRNKPIVIPGELQKAFSENKELEERFLCFTPGCRREFANYVSEAKRPETRRNRVQKIIQKIMQNIGLNDKYRK